MKKHKSVVLCVFLRRKNICPKINFKFLCFLGSQITVNVLLLIKTSKEESVFYGIYSNISDLKRWIKFIKGSNAYPYNLMKETNIINGTNIHYGFGLRIEEFNGHKLIYHCGSTIGTNTVVGYIEGTDVEFAMLLNCDNISCDKFIFNLKEYLKNA